jgi:hypothetical protein
LNGSKLVEKQKEVKQNMEPKTYPIWEYEKIETDSFESAIDEEA